MLKYYLQTRKLKIYPCVLKTHTSFQAIDHNPD